MVDLFKFGGGCDDPVCLSVGSAHGEHFNPAARTGQADLLIFLTDAIGTSVSNVPISAASSGAIWGTSPSGLPVRTATSAGPIFAERAQTIGRGRVLFGVNASGFSFQSLRGVPLNDLAFNFTHEPVGPGPLGTNADFENDVIEVHTDLAVSTFAVTGFITYGLTKQVDLSVAVPFVHTSLDGVSVAQIMPSSNATPHFFGDPSNPQLRSTASVKAAKSGIGDVATRAKATLLRGGRIMVALLADVRLPTGSEENFLGSGHTSFRALGILSGRYGNFSPHANMGFLARGSDTENDAFLATLGFDELIGGRTTFAVDMLSQWSVGANKLLLPSPVTISTPLGSTRSDRIIAPSNIANKKDDSILASIGFKFSTPQGITLVTNALIPVRRGGLQPNVGWTAGLEYSF